MTYLSSEEMGTSLIFWFPDFGHKMPTDIWFLMYVTSKENLSLNEFNDEIFAKLWYPTSCWTGSLSGAAGCGRLDLSLCITLSVYCNCWGVSSEFGSHNWCVMIFFCISCSKVPLDPYEGILFFDKLWTLHSDVSELLVNPRFFMFSIGPDVLSLSLSVLNVNLFVSRVTVKCEGNS